MRTRLFGNLSIVAFFSGILISPFITRYLVLANGGGDWFGLWTWGYFLKCLTVTALTSFVLGVLGLIRKERLNTASLSVLVFSFIGVFFIAITHINTHSDALNREKERLTKSRSLFSDQAWARIVDETGCPAKHGTGNANHMAGLWQTDNTNSVAFVRPNGATSYYSKPVGYKKCYKEIAKTNISAVNDSLFAQITEYDRSCNYAVPLVIETEENHSVSITATYPSSTQSPSLTKQSTRTWFRIGDALDHPVCSDLTETEIAAIEERERRRDPKFAKWYSDRDYRDGLITAPEYYGALYGILEQRILSCDSLHDHIGEIKTLQADRMFTSSLVLPRGQTTFTFNYTTEDWHGSISIDDLLDQALLDEHYANKGRSLDRVSANKNHIDFTAICVKNHSLNNNYIIDQVVKSIKGTDKAVISINSPTISILEIDGAVPVDSFSYFVAGKIVEVRLRTTLSTVAIGGGYSIGSQTATRVSLDTAIKSICLQLDAGEIYSFGTGSIGYQGNWTPHAYRQISPENTVAARGVPCDEISD